MRRKVKLYYNFGASVHFIDQNQVSLQRKITRFPKKMKKTLLAVLMLSTLNLMADGPWKLSMKTEKSKINLHLDLYEESIDVPGMDMFGPMNGYINGDVYGVWAVTSCEIVDSIHAKIRLSNDLGSETQECNLTLSGDSICKMELKGGVVIKRVEGKKLVKIDPVQVFKKK